MLRFRPLFFLLAASLFAGCASSRMLRVENKVLIAENETLHGELGRLRATQVDPKTFTMNVTMESLSELLTKSGVQHELNAEKGHIQLDYTGQNTSFSVTIQHYEKAQVVFIATSGYFALDRAQHTSSVVLLAVQLMALNYELLLGKFQMNPESGSILLSTELYVGDGLGHATLLQALDHLCQTADTKFPDLERAASGVGL